MSWYPPSSTHALYRQLPKVDLHRHLEGSMRLDTLMEVVKAHGITLPLRPGLRTLVQMQQDEPLTSSSFLAKFQILRLFYRSPEVIARITREAVADAAADGVLYLDLHFTPVALSRFQGFLMSDVMDWVAEAARKAAQEHHIYVRLIASVNRHESVQMAEEVARLAAERIPQGIAGLDLAGNEVEYPATPFAGVFREAKESGLATTLHAGEWGGPENVLQALVDFHVDRIIHGVRVLEDPNAAILAAEMGTPFEVCLTSNYQTGVVPSLRQHPLMQMVRAGINVTLNTDDPSISQITLSDEYRLACEALDMPNLLLADRIRAAACAAFLSTEERAALLERLRPGLAVLSEPPAE